MTLSKSDIAVLLKKPDLNEEQKQIIQHEHEILEDSQQHEISGSKGGKVDPAWFFDFHDLVVLNAIHPPQVSPITALQTLDELLDRDKTREKDGFPRRIRLGKVVKPSPDKKERIVVVPTTTEPKFYHDNSITEEEEEEQTGGSGEGEEGEVIGEQPVQPQEGEGEGAGQGGAGDHDVTSDAFDLGKVLTEKFSLPNLKQKGKKRSFTKYKYNLTDRNRGFGQILDKKETLRRVIKTNIMLGNIDPEKEIDPKEMLISPDDKVFRILSKEKDFESQAVVFFLRDYSGSMRGAPTEVVVTQHLFIYSWLVYQYKNNVKTRFILHDNEVKEVEDFYTYHNSQVAGGTSVYPAYERVNKIIEEEQLARDYNIYVFHGTDGDDWDTGGEKTIQEIKRLMQVANRIGITVARNSWSGGGQTAVEKYISGSGLLKQQPELIRMDSMQAEGTSETRLIEGIRRLIE